jgi:hypothetical protein
VVDARRVRDDGRRDAADAPPLEVAGRIKLERAGDAATEQDHERSEREPLVDGELAGGFARSTAGEPPAKPGQSRRRFAVSNRARSSSSSTPASLASLRPHGPSNSRSKPAVRLGASPTIRDRTPRAMPP